MENESPMSGSPFLKIRRLGALGPELAALLAGIYLRVRMYSTFRWDWGYDSYDHMRYIHYLVDKHRIPPLEAARTAYHPPLFYWIGAFILKHGYTPDHIRLVSIAAAIVRLVVLWYGLRRFLPERRLARVAALLLAAVIPCSLHIDGMVSNEGLNSLFCTIVLFLAVEAFRSQGTRRVWLCAGLGLALGAALMVKVSALVLVLLFLAGAAIEWATAPGSLRAKLERALPIIAAIEIGLLLSLPIQSRNQLKTRHLYPFGYDAHDKRAEMLARRVRDVPYLERRPLAFVYGLGTPQIFAHPWYPTDLYTESRFWPVLYASAFADYYAFFYASFTLPGERAVRVAGNRVIGARAQRYMIASTAAGLPITLAVVGAFLAAALALRRRWDLSRALLLATPVVAIAAQMHFAIKFPHDEWGPVKAAYLNFAAAPLFALFGVAVAWLWERKPGRAPAVLLLAALAVVGAYGLYGRGLIPGRNPTIAPPAPPPKPPGPATKKPAPPIHPTPRPTGPIAIPIPPRVDTR